MIKKNRLWIAPALALWMAGLGCVTVTRMFEPPVPTPLPLPTTETVPTEYAVPDEGKSHINLGDTGIYEHYPPSSGQHYGQTYEWGFYEEEVPPEYYVHNLEHGGIVVLYNCPEACPETEEALFQFFNHAPAESVFNEVKIIVSPNSQITSPVIALAWGWELDLEAVDTGLLLDFYDRHVNQGPELVP